jgi:hypothetical protein
MWECGSWFIKPRHVGGCGVGGGVRVTYHPAIPQHLQDTEHEFPALVAVKLLLYLFSIIYPIERMDIVEKMD